MKRASIACLLLGICATGCDETSIQLHAVGQLESERIELSAPVSQALLERPVVEGSHVDVGDLIFALESDLAVSQFDQVQAQVDERRAALAQLVEGTRVEQLEVARAELAGARRDRDFRSKELSRLTDLVARQLISEEQRDRASVALDAANASLDAATARADEMTAGPRQQTIAQSEARLADSQAKLREQRVLLSQHTTYAPAAAILDRYLFEIGERPKQGQVVAVLLGGVQPYARVYLPADIRSRVHVGDTADVRVDGIEQSVQGTVRWIAAEATFTPYFALTEFDRERLSYLAEINLERTRRRLPDGVPVQVTFDPGGG